MGLLKKKKQEEAPALPTSNKLQRMPSEDVYLFVETSLMTAQHQLTEYKALPEDMKTAALNWMLDNVNGAGVGIQELLNRNITP